MGLLNRRKTLSFFLAAAALWLILPDLANSAVELENTNDAKEVLEGTNRTDRWTTADHKDFDKLKQDFQSGPEVTRACLSCHNKAGEQVSETIHWTWICPADPSEQMGKAGLTLNNF